jgi:hypothetical protein
MLFMHYCVTDSISVKIYGRWVNFQYSIITAVYKLWGGGGPTYFKLQITKRASEKKKSLLEGKKWSLWNITVVTSKPFYGTKQKQNISCWRNIQIVTPCGHVISYVPLQLKMVIQCRSPTQHSIPNSLSTSQYFNNHRHKDSSPVIYIHVFQTTSISTAASWH